MPRYDSYCHDLHCYALYLHDILLPRPCTATTRYGSTHTVTARPCTVRLVLARPRTVRLDAYCCTINRTARLEQRPWTIKYDVVTFSSTNPGSPIFKADGSMAMAYKTWGSGGRCVGIVTVSKIVHPTGIK